MKKNEQHSFTYSRTQLQFTDELRIRQGFSYFFDSLMAYFVEDLIQKQWKRLVGKYQEIEDFEQLKTLLDYYIISLQRGMFLHRTEITGIIFQLINLANDFIHLVRRYQLEDRHWGEYKQLVVQMASKQNSLLRHFVSVIELCSKYSGQEGVYYLLERLNYQFD